MVDQPTLLEDEAAPAVSLTEAGGGRRLFFNSVAMAVANLAGRGLGYGYIILMAKTLAPRYLGAYGILVTTSLLVELVANLGLDKILIREIAAGSASVSQGYFRAALSVRLVMGAFMGAGAWLLLHALFKTRLLASPLSVAIFLCVIFPVMMSRNCEAFLTAHERLLPVAISQTCERIGIFFAVLALAMGWLTFSEMICLAPAASMLRFLVVGRSTARLWLRNVRPTHPHLPTFLRQSLELLSVDALAVVYFRSDMFFVARMAGMGSAGIYQICYKVFDLCVSLFSGFLQAIFPRMVRNKSRKSLLKILAYGVVALAFPVGAIILGRHSILNAIGHDYLGGSMVLVWLMLTVPLVYVTSTFVNMTIAVGRVRILIFCAVLLIVSNVGLNLFLIPRYGINGAAFSTFACELLSAVILGPFLLTQISFSEGAA